MKTTTIIAISLIILLGTMIFTAYKTSCVSAKIYNKINNTEFTCSDFFWASNQINSNSQTINIKQ